MKNIFCLPQIICCHLFGDNHSMKHRAVCGGCFSCIGFLLMYLGQFSHVHIIFDALGTSCHAIGFHPIIETIQTKKPSKENENPNS